MKRNGKHQKRSWNQSGLDVKAERLGRIRLSVTQQQLGHPASKGRFSFSKEVMQPNPVY